MRRTFLGLVLLAFSAQGCSGSRWARSDDVYAAKYPHHSDDLLQMTKQAVDARHVARRAGGYGSVMATDSPFTVGGGAGIFGYRNAWFEQRLGLFGLAGTGDENLFGGISGGLRAQTPTRLAPFIGIGAAGGVGFEKSADEDGIDNDHDILIDEPGETRDGAYVACFPETGVHFWLTPRLRLTGSASYNFTTTQGDDDFWMFSLELSMLTNDSPPPLPESCDGPIIFGEPPRRPIVRRLPPVP